MAGKSAHWGEQREKASGFWEMRFMLATYRLLGARRLRLVVYPIVFLFCLCAPGVCRLSRSFLKRAAGIHVKDKPRFMDTFRHIVSFA